MTDLLPGVTLVFVFCLTHGGLIHFDGFYKDLGGAQIEGHSSFKALQVPPAAKPFGGSVIFCRPLVSNYNICI